MTGKYQHDTHIDTDETDAVRPQTGAHGFIEELNSKLKIEANLINN